MANYKSITPFALVKFLDTKIIGQDEAKRSSAFFVYMHLKRFENRHKGIESPKLNLLLKGPTGSGKTLILSTLCEYLELPFEVVDITTFSETGYSGNDLEKFFSERSHLTKTPWPKYFKDIRDGETVKDSDTGKGTVEYRVAKFKTSAKVDLTKTTYGPIFFKPIWRLSDKDFISVTRAVRSIPAKEIEAGLRNCFLNTTKYAVLDPWELINRADEIASIFNTTFDITPAERKLSYQINLLEKEEFLELTKYAIGITETATNRGGAVRKITKWIDDRNDDAAMTPFEKDLADLLARLDPNKAKKKNADGPSFFEELGIIFFDEIDKLAAQPGQSLVSRDGVQRTLLKFIEGSDINGVKTNNIGFVAAGSFSSGFDIMPELMGRFGIRTTLNKLGRDDLYQIAKLPGSIYHNTFIEKNMLPFSDIEMDEAIFSYIVDVANEQNQIEYLGARVIANTFINILNGILIRECLEEITSARLIYENTETFKLKLVLRNGTEEEHSVEYGF